jgi:DTW domain-containing protein YfiP
MPPAATATSQSITAKKRKLQNDDNDESAATDPESSSSLPPRAHKTKPQVANDTNDDAAVSTAVAVNSISPSDRETVEVARVLSERIRRAFDRNDCPRCWLPHASCICPLTPAVSGDNKDSGKDSEQTLRCVNRIFVLMHQKEICLTVDTAKMILAAYPENCRLVVAGIGPEYQDSMKELNDALQQQNGGGATVETPSCVVILFPSPDATTVTDSVPLQTMLRAGKKVDVVVIDGTWKQARKIYHRYIHQERPSPHSNKNNNLVHIRLTDRALAQIAGGSSSDRQGGGSGHCGDGRQLRPHPEAWREIGTCAATRYLLQDLEGDDGNIGSTEGRYGDHVLAQYQARVNEAVQKLKRYH